MLAKKSRFSKVFKTLVSLSSIAFLMTASPNSHAKDEGGGPGSGSSSEMLEQCYTRVQNQYDLCVAYCLWNTTCVGQCHVQMENARGDCWNLAMDTWTEGGVSY
jgi:hypothetical protein